MIATRIIPVVATLLVACSAADGTGASESSGTTTGGGDTRGGPPEGGGIEGDTTAPSSGPSTGTDASEASSEAGTAEASSSASSGADGSTGDVPASDAAEWIIAHFAELEAPTITGDFDQRTGIETPALVLDSTGTTAKYAFDVREEEDPVLAEVGFVHVRVDDLVSPDGFGAAISTAYAPGAIAYLDDVYIEPNWPTWEGYDTTNYDGIVLDESLEFYAEDLTIVNWNADTAIDIKTPIAQFVRLELMGTGNRALRIWGDGPYYLVESSVTNPGGTLLWFSDCATVTLNVYASTFEGEDEVPEGAVQCEDGDAPNIVYLATDPRTTGEMHPMFSD